MFKRGYNYVIIGNDGYLGGKDLFLFLFRLSLTLLMLSILGYILAVLKEKVFLKRNMVVIDNKHLKQEDIDETDVNEFIFQGIKARSGDEVKLVTKSKKKYRGTIIGLKIDEGTIHIITNDNEVKKLDVKNIKDFIMLSKYGSFFNFRR